MKGLITQANADIILYIAIAVFILGLIYMFWPWLKIYLVTPLTLPLFIVQHELEFSRFC